MKKIIFFILILFVNNYLISKNPSSTRVEQIPHLSNQKNIIKKSEKLKPEEKIYKKNEERILQSINLGSIVSIQQFKDIILLNSLPSILLINEIFLVQGKIKIPNLFGVRVNIVFSRKLDKKKYTFSTKLQKNLSEFKIQVQPTEIGQYHIAIFIGQNGRTERQIQVVANSRNKYLKFPPQSPFGANIEIEQNRLKLSWSYQAQQQPCLSQIVFSQDNGIRSLKQSFIVSNCQTSFDVPFNKFYEFDEGRTFVTIKQAFSTDNSAYSQNSQFSEGHLIFFDAVQHNFQKISNKAQIENFSIKINFGEKLTIKGKSTVELRNEVIVRTPFYSFESYYLNPSQQKNQSYNFPAFVNFTLNLSFKTSGVYIISIISVTGQSLVNSPIYVGFGFPLLPDFQDLKPHEYDQRLLNQPANLNQRRSLLFKMINRVRRIFKVDDVIEDNSLDNLAQNYSMRMATQNFLSHVDPEGNSAASRAKNAGINSPVGENLALNNNITQAQLSLERSNGHLRNIVLDGWSKVGLGIYQNANGHYYITQLFSSRDITKEPLSLSQTNQIKQNLITFIQSNFNQITSEDKLLSETISNWSILSQYSRPNIFTFLRNRRFNGSLLYAEINVDYNSNYISQIQESSHLIPKNNQYNKVGMAVRGIGSKIHVFICYST